MKLLLTSIVYTLLSFIPSFGQDVAIVTTGQGRSVEEAKLNALRTAVEQAFGAFISSKTEIINDELKSDEIVTITNGNIKEFTIVDQWNVNQEQFLIVKSLVSLSTLSTYLQNKGHSEVSFDGNNFAFNIKLQKFNEESERIALKNVLTAFLLQSTNIIDKELSISEPQVYSGDLYKVRITVDLKRKENMQLFYSGLIESLRSIAMSKGEIQSYSQIAKKVNQIYPLTIKEENYSTLIASQDAISFRHPDSMVLLRAFLFCANMNLISSIKVKNEMADLSIVKSVDVLKVFPSNKEYLRGIYTINHDWWDVVNFWNHRGNLPFQFGNYHEPTSAYREGDMSIWQVLCFKDLYNTGNWTNSFPVEDFAKRYSVMSVSQQLDFVYSVMKDKKGLYHYDVNSFILKAPDNYFLRLSIEVPYTLEQFSQITKFSLE
jgi:hypothetical protein